MIGSVSLAGYSGAVGSTEKTSSVSSFDSVLRNEFGGFDYFKNSMNEYYGESFFHALDTSQISLWNRKDFPKELLFKESCTQKELEKVSLPMKEPASVSYGDITKTHMIAFVATPAAIEKMKSDPDFCNEVMAKIKAEIPKNWYNDMKENIDKNYDSIMTGAGITVEISEDGEVKFNIYSAGQSKRSDNEDCAEEIKESIKKLIGGNADVSVSVADGIAPYEEISQDGESDELFFENAAFAVSDILLRNHRG
ncbi:MAG: hypothetical protein HDT25_02550 [Ruminococcus sp.]|nr:hypothetical protein [Ruminococcus sp.]